MSAHTQPFSVPIVYQDLRPAESYLQAADSLARLEALAEAIFEGIAARVADERQRLEHVHGRLGVAQGKIEQVAGQTSRATMVQSPAQYPAPASIPVMPPVFAAVKARPPPPGVPQESGERRLRHRALRDAPHLPPDQAVPPPASSHETVLDELFASEAVGPEAAAASARAAARAAVSGAEQGLGRLPPNLPSISNLLLFNTQENPYRAYVSLDNLARKKKKRDDKDGDEDEKDGDKLADAPATFTEGDTLPAVAVLDYDYKPVLGAVPELDLPSFLPNLDGVADLTYDQSAQGQQQTSIAPSALPGDVLPDIAPNDGTAPNDPQQQQQQPQPGAGDAGGGGAPPPPPPPDAPAPPAPPAAPAPPPPPSAADEIGTLQDDGGGQAPSAPPPEGVPEEVGGRGGLLADIRKGHKSRLKSAKKRALPKKDPIDDDGGSGGGGGGGGGGTGDIFGDLMQALNRRRQGIAATREKAESKSTRADDLDDIAAPAMDEWGDE